MKDKFYITTAIDYLNAKPHIGHAFERILADVIARYWRLKGKDVFFLNGSDEHGLKVQQAADLAGISPREFVDILAADFISMKEKFNISRDRFIRTTEPEHIKAAQELWRRCKEAGDIYLKNYQGLYCAGCEAFIKASDLVDGKCSYHGKAPEVVEEENWFFKLSRHKETIKELIDTDNLLIVPEHRKQEILNILEELDDFSISRPKTKLAWGIEVPDDKNQNIYVWFDALTNYLSGIGWLDDKETFNKYWPADLHVIGKEISRFHTIYWPAMLLSAGIILPRAILIHGHIISGGKKMSKSLGNVISPDDAATRHGIDALRYFLIREIPTLDDGDFTWEKFDARYSADLANGLGNLVSRVSNLMEKNEISILSDATPDKGGEFVRQAQDDIENFRLNRALEKIWQEIDRLNKEIDTEKPWQISDKKRLAPLLSGTSMTGTLIRDSVPLLWGISLR